MMEHLRYKIEEISKDLYLENFNKLEKNKQKYIDTNQYSDKYLVLHHNGTLKAFVGIRLEKNSMAFINGLFSLEKGSGKFFIDLIEDKYNYKFLRLNCTGIGLLKYYKQQRFTVYFSDTSTDYYELYRKKIDKSICQ